MNPTRRVHFAAVALIASTVQGIGSLWLLLQVPLIQGDWLTQLFLIITVAGAWLVVVTALISVLVSHLREYRRSHAWDRRELELGLSAEWSALE